MSDLPTISVAVNARAFLSRSSKEVFLADITRWNPIQHSIRCVRIEVPREKTKILNTGLCEYFTCAKEHKVFTQVHKCIVTCDISTDVIKVLSEALPMFRDVSESEHENELFVNSRTYNLAWSVYFRNVQVFGINLTTYWDLKWMRMLKNGVRYLYTNFPCDHNIIRNIMAMNNVSLIGVVFKSWANVVENVVDDYKPQPSLRYLLIGSVPFGSSHVWTEDIEVSIDVIPISLFTQVLGVYAYNLRNVSGCIAHFSSKHNLKYVPSLFGRFHRLGAAFNISSLKAFKSDIVWPESCADMGPLVIIDEEPIHADSTLWQNIKRLGPCPTKELVLNGCGYLATLSHLIKYASTLPNLQHITVWYDDVEGEENVKFAIERVYFKIRKHIPKNKSLVCTLCDWREDVVVFYNTLNKNLERMGWAFRFQLNSSVSQFGLQDRENYYDDLIHDAGVDVTEVALDFTDALAEDTHMFNIEGSGTDYTDTGSGTDDTDEDD